MQKLVEAQRIDAQDRFLAAHQALVGKIDSHLECGCHTALDWPCRQERELFVADGKFCFDAVALVTLVLKSFLEYRYGDDIASAMKH